MQAPIMCMGTWEVIAGSSTFPLENPKTPAVLYFIKWTTWSLWSVFGTRIINVVGDEL